MPITEGGSLIFEHMNRPYGHDKNPGLRGHGLDFQNMTDADLHNYNMADIKSVDSSASDSDIFALGDSLWSPSDSTFIVNLMKAQVRQRWIIIRQNEQIIRQNREIIRLLRESTGRQPYPAEEHE